MGKNNQYSCLECDWGPGKWGKLKKHLAASGHWGTQHACLTSRAGGHSSGGGEGTGKQKQPQKLKQPIQVKTG